MGYVYEGVGRSNAHMGHIIIMFDGPNDMNWDLLSGRFLAWFLAVNTAAYINDLKRFACDDSAHMDLLHMHLTEVARIWHMTGMLQIKMRPPRQLVLDKKEVRPSRAVQSFAHMRHVHWSLDKSVRIWDIPDLCQTCPLT